ncbi:unnamed protein product [Mytilus edulis]|uniref:Uncharacterized protein n=1 Tax=Mytilus edulis TaxID=6550 RepID=A0A8S3UW34_MYTED|nr:unnamed protein product [Mytilus edulis]
MTVVDKACKIQITANSIFFMSILWRKGPNWLVDSTKWPELNSTKNTVLTSLVDDIENEEELDNLDMTHQNSLGSITNILDISNYGSYMKLLRITAYVIRFIRNCRRDRISRKSGPLEVNEIQTAVNTWILDCQESTYTDEMSYLRGAQHRNTNKVPRVRQLGLFLDESGLIRLEIWNSLPEKVVSAPTIPCFEARLDRYWENQTQKYNYSEKIHTTGQDLSKKSLDKELTEEDSSGILQSEEDL